jgi:hypothetical protein
MTMSSDLLSRLRPWNFQPRVPVSGRSMFWCALAHLNKPLTERIALSSVNTPLIFAWTWCSPH